MTYLWRDQLYDTQREVAEAAGVHHRTVSDHLSKYGHLERLGEFKAPDDMSAKTARNAEIVAMQRDGVSYGQIGRKFGISRERAFRIVKQARAGA